MPIQKIHSELYNLQTFVTNPTFYGIPNPRFDKEGRARVSPSNTVEAIVKTLDFSSFLGPIRSVETPFVVPLATMKAANEVAHVYVNVQ